MNKQFGNLFLAAFGLVLVCFALNNKNAKLHYFLGIVAFIVVFVMVSKAVCQLYSAIKIYLSSRSDQ
jgi:heme A synthase